MKILYITFLFCMAFTFAHAQQPKASLVQGSNLTIQKPGASVQPNPEKYVRKIADTDALSGLYLINNPLLMQNPIFKQSSEAVTQYLMGIQGVKKCSFDGSGSFKIQASNAKITTILIQNFGFTQTELNTTFTN